MGILTNISSLDVNWHVSGLNVRASGTIEWKGETYELEDAPAYSDHNWGNVFPQAWIWMQGNGFENDPEAAVALAGGPRGIGPIQSPAFMLVYRTSYGLFEFRSQDLNTTFELDLDSDNGRLHIIATKDLERVGVIADVNPNDFHVARVPTLNGMEAGSLQTFKGNFTVNRYRKKNGVWEQVQYQVTKIGVLELGGEYGGF